MNGSRQCEVVLDTGKRCRSHPLLGSKYCYFHDPARANDRKRAQKAGGHANRRRPPEIQPNLHLHEVSQVRDHLSGVLAEVEQGSLSHQVGTTVGYLSRVILKSIEMTTLEDRVAALEHLVNESSSEPDIDLEGREALEVEDHDDN